MRVSEVAALKDAFERQAIVCGEMGAPFTGRLIRLLCEHLDDATALGRRVLGWPEATLRSDLVPLRCCGALNLKVRGGVAPMLAQHYPPHLATDAGLAAALADTIARHDRSLTAFLDSPPQTNEVARSGVLLAGFLAIAATTRMPLALLELGASAGLNLMFDRYAYDLGEGRTWGADGARVRIPCLWSGAAPSLATPIEVVSRAAVDLRPISASEPKDRERLLAYIWPEQTDRVRRIEAALDMLAAARVTVEADDAVGWAKRRLAAPQTAATCRVVYHSVFLQYLPQEARQALRSVLESAGAAATTERPFAWLAMEAAPDAPTTCQLTLRLWPGGERRVLAQVDWHGKWARFPASS